jgi:hypothetical protein
VVAPEGEPLGLGPRGDRAGAVSPAQRRRVVRREVCELEAIARQLGVERVAAPVQAVDRRRLAESPAGAGPARDVDLERAAAVRCERELGSISGEHAVFRRRGATVEVEDLSSRNGTWLDGQKLMGCAELFPGSVVRIGPAQIWFVAASAARMNIDAPAIDGDAVSALLRYRWPGNVRELRNAIERAVALCRGGKIVTTDLPEPVHASPAVASSVMRERLGDAERKAIVSALAAERGNQTRAARLLGISRRNLVYKLAKYDLR